MLIDKDSIGCGGGQKYPGFVEGLRSKFEYFLSCSILGEMEGERYKKTPPLNPEFADQPQNDRFIEL